MSDLYPGLALRTASTDFFPERADADSLMHLWLDATEYTEMLDRYKRLLYYAVPKMESDPELHARSAADDGLPARPIEPMPALSAAEIDLLHAALGLMTEAGEVMDAVCGSIFGEGRPALDLTNLKEEAGDVRWYLALMERALGLTRVEVEAANIRKLTQRNGGTSFNAEGTANRDTDAERDAITPIADVFPALAPDPDLQDFCGATHIVTGSPSEGDVLADAREWMAKHPEMMKRLADGPTENDA